MESLLSAALAELDADEEGEEPAVVAAKVAEPVAPPAVDIGAGASATQASKAATTGTPPAGSEEGSAGQPGGGWSGGAATASSSSSGAAGGKSDDGFAGMEETLAALARSAETLASMGGESEGDESTAMLEMLAKQLQEIGIGDDGDDLGLESLLGGAGGSAAGGRGGGGGSGPSDSAIDGLLDGLVGQLLSKEVMLEPMQTLHAEFPRFLSEKGGTLSAADKSRYERQQLIVAQIVAAYEHIPNDTDKVAQLMQEMQACGPPPSELAAPGMPGTDACCIS